MFKQTNLDCFKKILFLVSISQIILSCGNLSNKGNIPPIMLWAWERNEDLSFLQSKDIGIAYLAQTIYLTNEEVILKPRRQPIKIPSKTYIIAVTRIETKRERIEFTQSQIEETAALIRKSSLSKNIKGIQVDFDVKVSERDFYGRVLKKIKENILDQKFFSITALASFCIGDRWMKDLPIDEAVPMLFEMGKDKKEIISHLKKANDFNESPCKKSYGLLLNENLKVDLKENRSRYYFNYRSWKKGDVEKLK